MLVGIGIRESDCRLIYGLNQALKKEAALFCIIEENELCHATFILVVATFTQVASSSEW